MLLPNAPSSGKKREFRFHPIKETVVEEPVDVTPYLDQLDESLRDKVLQLQKGRWVESLPYLRGFSHGASCYIEGGRGKLRLHGKCLWLTLGNMGRNREAPFANTLVPHSPHSGD